MRQLHGLQPSGVLLCYDLDEIRDALEGLKLVWTTVSRFERFYGLVLMRVVMILKAKS